MSDIATVIPARGGSKHVPNKNILPLLGKPMLAYTVEAALESGVTGQVFVSTDSGEIAGVARQYGAQVIDRPVELSVDAATTESALIHALDVLAGQGLHPEWVLTLQPSSPLRSVQTIRDFVAAFRAVSDRFDSMLSVTEDRVYKWVKAEGDALRPLFPKAGRRRQDREPLYSEDSVLYITRVHALRTTGSIFGRNVTGFSIDPIEAVDINESIDFEWAEFLLQKRQVKR